MTDTTQTSSGLSPKAFFMVILFVLVTFSLLFGVMALLTNNQRNASVEEAKQDLNTISAEISQVVEKNKVSGESQMSGTSQDVPVDGRVVDAVSNKEYLFTLPAAGRTALLSDKSYISVSGTVDDYKITWSSDSQNVVAVYNSKSDEITVSKYES